MHAEHHDGGIGIADQDLARRFHAVEMRHGHVHHHYVRLLLDGDLHRFATIGRFPDHFKSFVALQQQTQTRAHNGVIVGQ
jgi:hypothetical protein